MRDIQADYKAAYIDEHASYKAAGRDEDAAAVAKILREHYDHDVDAEDEPDTPVQEQQGEPETTAAAPPPETAVEPRPATPKAGPGRRTAAKKTAAKDSE